MESIVAFYLLAVSFCNILCVSADSKGRVIGGSETGKDDYKFMVAFLRFDHVKFGGTLISQRVVLTAAHNLKTLVDGSEATDIYKAVVGQPDISKATTFYKIKTFKVHEDYQTDIHGHDIAVVLLEESVPTSDVAEIPGYIDIEEVSNCQVLGWGYTTAAAAKTSDVLKIANVEVQKTLEKCEGTGTDENKICYVGVTGNTCGGDSGGPLMCTFDEERMQIGVVSSTINNGGECGQVTGASIASSVATHFDWIRSNAMALGP